MSGVQEYNQECNPGDQPHRLVGRAVAYTPTFGPIEQGTITKVDDHGRVWVRFKGPLGERCPVRLLTTLDGRPVGDLL